MADSRCDTLADGTGGLVHLLLGCAKDPDRKGARSPIFGKRGHGFHEIAGRR